MRIRRLTDPNKLIRGGEPLLLAPNKTVELAPDVLVQVELDLAVRVDPGSALLIVPLPSLLEAGVIAAVGVVTASDPLSPLTISVRAIAPATLRPNKPIEIGHTRPKRSPDTTTSNPPRMPNNCEVANTVEIDACGTPPAAAIKEKYAQAPIMPMK